MKKLITLALLAFVAGSLTGCQSMKEMVNLGDGKIMGLVSVDIAGVELPDGTVVDGQGSLIDTLMQLGVVVGGNAAMDKWNIKEVVNTTDAYGNEVTKIVTEYGITFTVATGEIKDRIKAISFAAEPETDALQVVFEDVEGKSTVKTLTHSAEPLFEKELTTAEVLEQMSQQGE